VVAHPIYKSGEPMRAATLWSKNHELARSILAGRAQCIMRDAIGIGDGTNLVLMDSFRPLKKLCGAELKRLIVSAYGWRALERITE
jgi:hypothetical protein